MTALAGLSQLSRQIGRPVSEAALRSRVTASPDGQLNFESMVAALDASGLDLSRAPVSREHLSGESFPVLAALHDGSYKLLASADALLSSDITDNYAGHLLRLHSRPSSDRRSEIPDKPNARAWFWRVLWNLRGYYVHVLFATLVTNVLSLAISLYTMNVYDRVVPNKTYETLWVLTIGSVGALLFDFAARMLRGWLTDAAGKRADLEISAALFRRVLDMKLVAKPASSGSFVNNLRDFESIRDVLTSATLTALIDLPFLLLFVAVIVVIAPTLAVVPIVAIVLVTIAGLLIQGPLARRIRESMKEGSQRQGLAVEAVEGLETLKVNNAQQYAAQRWEWYGEKVADSSSQSRHLSNLVINFTGMVQQLASIATVVMGVYLIHDGKLTMGGLIAAVILCGRAIAPLAQLAGLLIRIQQARTAFDGLQALMDKEIERDSERTYLSLPKVRGELTVSQIEFAHEAQAGPLFRNFNLHVAAGEKVAILGRSGSGKSTLLRLAAGLYTPAAGQVMIDGLDLRGVDPVDTRIAIGLLPQDARLFLGTLRENLDMARRDRPLDDAQLLEVLRQFGLDRMIRAHPRGMDMFLGEDGLGLSGGQKQLVTLARVMLRDPQIALLDEPTSGLDPNTETQVLQALAKWTASGPQSRTLVMVTHRPQVLEIVDRVIVIEQGKIVLDAPRAKALEQLSKGITVARETQS